MPEQYLTLGQDRFFPYPFLFIIIQPFVGYFMRLGSRNNPVEVAIFRVNATFALKMISGMFGETSDKAQHSTPLNSGSRIHTLNSNSKSAQGQQYRDNDNQSFYEGRRGNYRNVQYIQYYSENGQCPTQHFYNALR
jgi:hypothetical protein